MLFMDYVLSKEGQGVLRDTFLLPAHPQVDPVPALKMAVPRLNGVSESSLSASDEAKMLPKSMEWMEDYFRGK